MNVISWSRSGRSPEGVESVSLDELLEVSDVVSIHVALSPETKYLIGRRELSLMKPGAILINTARGPIVDQGALCTALESGHLGAAGLDVFETEPISVKEPILQLPNCLVLPHIGSATQATREAMASLAVDNILAELRGDPLPFCANPEVYSTKPSL